MKKSILLLFLLVLNTLYFPNTEACTGIKLTAKDGSIATGRTVEFATSLELSSVVIPRGYAFVGTTPIGKGLKYRAKYASVGIVCFDEIAILDGMNEKGLAVGTFYFPGFAGYTPVSKENQSIALSPTEFPNWLLTQFATIEEVRAALDDIVIVPTKMPNWQTNPPPFHYIVYDKEGKSLVIEPIGGDLISSTNPLGILTNSPTFHWQMNNLCNYVNLSPNDVKAVEIGSLTFTPFGQGSGLLGLPGDFTPPSRFVRAAFFSTTALPQPSAKNAVWQAFHILNQFDIPYGAVRSVENEKTTADYTQMTSVKDPQSLRYYFKTYGDQTVRVIDLNDFDMEAPTLKKASLSSPQTFVNFSSKLTAIEK